MDKGDELITLIGSNDVFQYIGDIVPKPRMTRSDTWKKRPIVLKYYEFKDNIKRQAKAQSFALGNAFAISFNIQIPKSRKDLLEGDEHLQRPDLDNLLKAVQDCLLKEDSGIWGVVAVKLWTTEPSNIQIQNLDREDLLENI